MGRVPDQVCRLSFSDILFLMPQTPAPSGRLGGTMARPHVPNASIYVVGCWLVVACAACGPRDTGGPPATAVGQQPPATASAEPAAASPAGNAPRILSQPQNAITRESEPIALRVTADGIPLPTYQWSKDGRDIVGATDATYRVSRARPTDAGTYQVAVTNAAGSVLSHPVAVVVETTGAAPVITTPPLDLTVSEGNQASMKVIASGTAPLSYLWSKEGRPGFLSNEAELFIASARPEDSGTYAVEVSNRYGKASAFCRLTVNSLSADTSSAGKNRSPQILAQPQNVMTRENEPIVLQVTADSVLLPTYQWSKDGSDIIGATDATYRVPRARAADAGTYQVAVTNAAGSVLSRPAMVIVLETAGAAPLITTPPSDLTVLEGNQASARVVASGTPALSYLWSKEGRPGFVSNEAALFIASAKPEDGGTYMVEVSNRYGKATTFWHLTVSPR